MAEKHPIPKNYRDEVGDICDNPAYIRAWQHAKRHNNTDKACRVYADAHWQEFEEKGQESLEGVQRQIAELKAREHELQTQAAAGPE